MDYYYPIVKENVPPWDESNADESLENIFKLHQKDFLSTVLTEGFYAVHYLRWAKLYNSSQLMFIDGSEMLTNPGEVMERIQEFANLPKLLLKEDYVADPNNAGFFCYKDWQTVKLDCLSTAKRRTRNKLGISNETSYKLKSLYRSHNEALFNMLGRRFLWD